MLLCCIWRFGDGSKVCFASLMLIIGSFLQCAMAENSVKFCLVHLVRYSKIFRASGLFFCTTLFSALLLPFSLALSLISYPRSIEHGPFSGGFRQVSAFPHTEILFRNQSHLANPLLFLVVSSRLTLELSKWRKKGGTKKGDPPPLLTWKRPNKQENPHSASLAKQTRKTVVVVEAIEEKNVTISWLLAAERMECLIDKYSALFPIDAHAKECTILYGTLIYRT